MIPTLTWQLTLAIEAVLVLVLLSGTLGRRAGSRTADAEDSLRAGRREELDTGAALLAAAVPGYEPAHVPTAFGLAGGDFGLASVHADRRRRKLEQAYSLAFRAGIWLLLVVVIFIGGRMSADLPGRAQALQPATFQRALQVTPAKPVYCDQDLDERCLVCEHYVAAGQYARHVHC